MKAVKKGTRVRYDRVFFMTLIALTCMYMPFLVQSELERPGYFAIGGEWLVVPLIAFAWIIWEI